MSTEHRLMATEEWAKSLEGQLEAVVETRTMMFNLKEAYRIGLGEAQAEVARLRAMIEEAKQNTDGGCVFCRRDPWTEGHAEDCGK